MQDKNASIDLIFILSLFAMFTVTAIATVLIGVKIYRHTTNTMDSNYEIRTFSSYLTEKVRQHDSKSAISTGTVAFADVRDPISVLMLDETVNDTTYTTYLYLYDGYVRELTVEQGTPLVSGSSGQQVIPCNALSFENKDGHILLATFVTESGIKNTLSIPVHTIMGGAYFE